jgi:hypothetical protein
LPALIYGVSNYERSRGDFTSFPVVNMFAEQVTTEEKVTLQSRPGIGNSGTSMGAGPVQYLFQIDGVLTGNLFGISNTSLYSGSTLIGAIDGTGPAKLDGYEGYLFATCGTRLWGYNGVTLAAVTTPDNFEVLDLCVGASRLVVINKNTGKFYWSDALTANIDALSFATAENSPDKLKACLYVGDILLLFGSETVEMWPVSTDSTSPFQPLIGRVFPVGIKDTGCATKFRTTFAWVTNDNQVCIGTPEDIISGSDLEAKILEASDVSLWSFMLEGVEYLALRLDDETHVFSSRSKTWSEFQSYGETNWVPQCYGGGYFGSSLNGNLIEWTDDHSDFEDVLERRFRAGLILDSGAVPLNNLSIRTNPGRTPFLSGDYEDPTIEMRTSKDGGNIWSTWRSRSLGEQGQLRSRVQWRSLGHFSQPGLVVEFRVVDPVPFRVSNVVINEPYGSV